MDKRQKLTAASSRKSPLVLTLRILLAAMSVVGFLGWTYITLFILGHGGRRIFFSPVVIIVLFGHAYLLLSLLFCFKNPSLKYVTVMGIVLNLPLVVAFIYAVSHIEDKLNFAAFVPMAFVLTWCLFGLARWFVATSVSTPKQIASVAGICVGILLALAAIRPLTVDPETEARRLSERAAQATNPKEAKQLFAKAMEQAQRINNPHRRDQPLGVIAYNQAKAGLVSDAKKTASQCEWDGARKIAFNSIIRAQVELADLQGAVLTAKSHEAGAVLFMALKEASIANAQLGRIEKATEIMRFAEQTAADPAFESLQRWSFSAVAMAQAQLGLHDEAISSARKTGAEYAPEQMAFVAMTEKQAGHLDHARFSVEESIRGVMAIRKDTVSRDNTFFEIADHLVEAGMFDEARVMADSIQSATTKKLFIRSMDHKRATLRR